MLGRGIGGCGLGPRVGLYPRPRRRSWSKATRSDFRPWSQSLDSPGGGRRTTGRSSWKEGRSVELRCAGALFACGTRYLWNTCQLRKESEVVREQLWRWAVAEPGGNWVRTFAVSSSCQVHRCGLLSESGTGWP